jgi:hypothetical protein
MNSYDIWSLVIRMYDAIETALWAGLFSFLLVFASLIAPKIAEYRAHEERKMSQEIAAENSAYCEKWGMEAGSQRHCQCLLDLGEFRQKVERRIADNDF